MNASCSPRGGAAGTQAGLVRGSVGRVWARGGGECAGQRCQSEAHACGAGLAGPIYWVGAGAS